MHTNTPKTQPRLQSVSRESFWQRHVDQWQDSDLSKMAYCKQYALAYHQMVYWSSKLQQSDVSPIGERNGFVAVSVKGPFSATATEQTLSVRLPNGAVIEGINDQSVALVGKLLQQL